MRYLFLASLALLFGAQINAADARKMQVCITNSAQCNIAGYRPSDYQASQAHTDQDAAQLACAPAQLKSFRRLVAVPDGPNQKIIVEADCTGTATSVCIAQHADDCKSSSKFISCPIGKLTNDDIAKEMCLIHNNDGTTTPGTYKVSTLRDLEGPQCGISTIKVFCLDDPYPAPSEEHIACVAQDSSKCAGKYTGKDFRSCPERSHTLPIQEVARMMCTAVAPDGTKTVKRHTFTQLKDEPDSMCGISTIKAFCFDK